MIFQSHLASTAAPDQALKYDPNEVLISGHHDSDQKHLRDPSTAPKVTKHFVDDLHTPLKVGLCPDPPAVPISAGMFFPRPPLLLVIDRVSRRHD